MDYLYSLTNPKASIAGADLLRMLSTSNLKIIDYVLKRMVNGPKYQIDYLMDALINIADATNDIKIISNIKYIMDYLKYS